ncbi:MAG: type 4a pilus biogenesis protein PilO [Acidimicrobiia bacterium]
MNRTAILIGALAVILVTGLWYVVFLSSVNDDIASAQDELSEAQNEELRLESQLKRLQRIQENQLLYVEALGTVETAVPPTPQEAALLDALTVLETESGVVLEGVTLSFPQDIEGEDYSVIPMSMVIEGQYFEVLGFVYGLEDLDRIVVIKNVTISTSENDDGFTILRVNIVAEAYTTSPLILPEPSEGEQPEEGAATTTTEPGGEE